MRQNLLEGGDDYHFPEGNVNGNQNDGKVIKYVNL
jgi:hypothetical protein